MKRLTLLLLILVLSFTSCSQHKTPKVVKTNHHVASEMILRRGAAADMRTIACEMQIGYMGQSPISFFVRSYKQGLSCYLTVGKFISEKTGDKENVFYTYEGYDPRLNDRVEVIFLINKKSGRLQSVGVADPDGLIVFFIEDPVAGSL